MVYAWPREGDILDIANGLTLSILKTCVTHDFGL